MQKLHGAVPVLAIVDFTDVDRNKIYAYQKEKWVLVDYAR